MKLHAAVLLGLSVALAGCLGGGSAPAPQGDRVVIELPRRAEPPVDRTALRDALAERHVTATIREAGDADRAVTITRTADGATATVAFDEELSGKLQAQGLVDCLGPLRGQRIAVVGAADDAVRRGRDYVLDPLVAQDLLHRVDDHERADGVLADDRRIAGRLRPGAVVAGHGITTEIVRDIVAGRWCLTMYEAPDRVAEAAAALAAALASGGPAPGRPLRLAPDVISPDTLAARFGDPGFPPRAAVCAGTLAARCELLDG